MAYEGQFTQEAVNSMSSQHVTSPLFNTGSITIVLGILLVGYVFQNLFVFDSLLSLLGLIIYVGIIFSFIDSRNSIKDNDKKCHFLKKIKEI